MNIVNLYVYENRSMSSDLSKPLMLENLNVDNVQIHIPKEIDGTDMGTWAWWFVYQNAKREKYSISMTLEGTTNDEGEEEYISTVGLNHGFTGKHGQVYYAIEAIQADGSGTITGEWHTKTYKEEIVYTLQGNQTEYDESESDIISALISRVNELIQSGAEIAEIAATIEAAAETAQEVIDSIPPDYSTLSAQVDTNTEDICGLKADLGDLSELETETKTDLVSAINEAAQSGDGLTADIKEALLACFDHVVWDDDDPTGQTYITALQNALYPPAELVSISAVYTQSGTVYDTDALNSLKSDLIVTALMSDQTTQTITDYTLSGTLADGTSTITVSYGGKTATFTVTVSTHLMYSLYNHEFTGDMSVSPVIDTGIQFFDEDFSWTIICELNKETAYTHGWRLFGALRDTSPYNGFYHGSSNNTASGNTNVKWIDGTTSSANNYMKGAWTGTYKCAFVHQSGGGLSEYFKGNNDSVITKSLSNAWSQISDANTLEIGGIPGVPAAALIGTIVKCEIYDYAFSSSEINAFMEGS